MESSRFVSSDLPEAIMKFNRKLNTQLIFSRNNQCLCQSRVYLEQFQGQKKSFAIVLHKALQFINGSSLEIHGCTVSKPLPLSVHGTHPCLDTQGKIVGTRENQTGQRKIVAVNFPLEFPPKVSRSFWLFQHGWGRYSRNPFEGECEPCWRVFKDSFSVAMKLARNSWQPIQS